MIFLKAMILILKQRYGETMYYAIQGTKYFYDYGQESNNWAQVRRPAPVSRIEFDDNTTP
jgi:hypothetical protein